MAGLTIPSSNALTEGHFGGLFLIHTATTSSFTYTYNPPEAAAMSYVLGVDMVAARATVTTQCFCDMYILTSAFYHDSQSIGEGGGVTFSWRGQIPLISGQTLTVDGESDSDAHWSVVAWGIWGPYQPYP